MSLEIKSQNNRPTRGRNALFPAFKIRRFQYSGKKANKRVTVPFKRSVTLDLRGKLGISAVKTSEFICIASGPRFKRSQTDVPILTFNPIAKASNTIQTHADDA